MYYNTTKQTGEKLDIYQQNAKNQDHRLFVVMQQNPNMAYGASDFTKIFKNMLLTSIRRSLNTLERKGLITKTGNKQDGLFGHPENTYKYEKTAP